MSTTRTYSVLRTPLFFLWAILALALVSCEDLLEQKPPDTGSNVLPEQAIRTGDDLQELLNSAYDVLGNTYNGSLQNPFNLLTDNAARPNNHDDYTSIWLRSTTVFNGTLGPVFRDLYIAILRANTVIENLDNVEGLNADDRGRLEAEARFIRALCHFDAVRGWAQPYGYTSSNTHPGVAIRVDTRIDNAPRATVSAVYNQVLSDVVYARQNLPDYNDVYATRWSAMALEAEVRFQMHDYQAAYDMANQVIDHGPHSFDSEVYNKYRFPEPGPESIFYVFSALRPDGNVDSRNSGFRDQYYAGGSRPTLGPSPELYTLATQNAGPESVRANHFQEEEIDGNAYYFTTLFDEEYFNVPILTITQMKLIRAESAAEMGVDLALAIQDINDIRERAYGGNMLNLLSTASAQEVIDAARKERRMEFPFNGQRLHDVKRIGSQGEDILVRGAPWDCPGMLLQFPATEQTELFPLNPRGDC